MTQLMKPTHLARAASDPDGTTTVAKAYRSYYSSGHYERRYPGPNLQVLAKLERLLPPGGRLLDFGCGTGRYLVAAMAKASDAVAYDISDTALEILRRKLADLRIEKPVATVGPDPADLTAELDRGGPADLVLCLFGVLSHIDSPARRIDTLADLKRWLKPVTGRLLISVPNRHRRFRAEQRAQASGSSGQITFDRQIPGGTISFDYKLFDPGSLSLELRQAGFLVDEIAAESLFPEAMVANYRICRVIEAMVGAWLPARFGYGIIAVARPDPASTGDLS